MHADPVVVLNRTAAGVVLRLDDGPRRGRPAVEEGDRRGRLEGDQDGQERQDPAAQRWSGHGPNATVPRRPGSNGERRSRRRQLGAVAGNAAARIGFAQSGTASGGARFRMRPAFRWSRRTGRGVLPSSGAASWLLS